MPEVRNRQELIATLQRHAHEIHACGAERLGVFGSFVRDEQRADSDVDLLVEFDAGCKTFDNFMTLSLLLERLLQRRVELVTREALSPYIGPRILDEVEYVPLAA